MRMKTARVLTVLWFLDTRKRLMSLEEASLCTQHYRVFSHLTKEAEETVTRSDSFKAVCHNYQSIFIILTPVASMQ